MTVRHPPLPRSWLRIVVHIFVESRLGLAWWAEVVDGTVPLAPMYVQSNGQGLRGRRRLGWSALEGYNGRSATAVLSGQA